MLSAILIIKQELSHDSIARLNCALPITKIRADSVARLPLAWPHTHTLRVLTIMCVYVGYTELTCIPDLGLNADLEGQVLSSRSLVCVSMCECVTPCMLN